MLTGTPALVISGAQVMDAAGRFVPGTVTVTADGRFGDVTPADTVSPAPEAPAPAADTVLADTVLDGRGRWLLPGIYDCHCHITWNDFHHDQRDRKTPQQQAAETAAALWSTLRAGVTSLRDAGGAPAWVQAAAGTQVAPGPRLQIAVDMIGADQAGTASAMRGHVEAALAKGAQWIKLMATAGSSTPGDAVLKSNFSEAEIRAAVETARAGGARVMMHTWGGDSADWAIEHGVASVEHGIYFTPEQVSAAAAAGMTLVPTLTIYRLVRDMVLSGELGGVAFDRIVAVIEAHEDVIGLARDRGLPLAVGSDYSTPEQHGTNLVEIGALMRAGLPAPDALLAATANGAALLNDPDGGRIAPGLRADAVLLTADPADPATFDDPASVAAVVKDGQVVYRA
jgi:imidazolonepropionase-like amidohydrolase